MINVIMGENQDNTDKKNDDLDGEKNQEQVTEKDIEVAKQVQKTLDNIIL